MIGLLGGSFDPVHIGHLRLALEIQHGLGLQQVRLIPSGTPPHRGAPAASVAQRVAMLNAAVQDEPGLCVDERELQRSGPSYTIDTLISLRAELGNVPLCLILGMDAFLHLPGWRRWRELLSFAHIVVAQRPGCAITNAADELTSLLTECRVSEARALADQPAGHILTWPVSQLDISSSHIRRLLSAGGNIRYLVPDAVLAVIQHDGLYQNKELLLKEGTHEK